MDELKKIHETCSRTECNKCPYAIKEGGVREYDDGPRYRYKCKATALFNKLRRIPRAWDMKEITKLIQEVKHDNDCKRIS